MPHRILILALEVALALAGVAVRADVVAVVSANSPVTTLTKSEVMDIFLSKRTHFPDGTSAVPIDQREGSAARDQFYSVYGSMSAAQIKAFWSRIIFTGRGQPPKSVSNGEEAKKLVAADPNAIAYIDQSMVDSSVRVVLAP